MQKMNNSFLTGVKDGIPICLGYISVSFAFGIIAVGAGLDIWQALVISMTNLTSAGQLAAVPIIATLGSVAELASTQLVINMRYALMSVSLSQKLGSNVRFIDRFWIAFCNTDEVFAVASGNEGTVGRRYMLGLVITPYFGWSFGTLIGAIAGNVLPQMLVSALGVAMYGMFIAIIVPPAKKSLPTALCVFTAILMSCCMNFIPLFKNVGSGFIIIICAVLSSLIFALLAPLGDTEDRSEERCENE